MNPSDTPAKGRILVIEDSPTQLLVARRLLTSHGYEVITASDGVQGIQAASVELPDVVVTDVLMPGLNGYQVCRVLKDDALTRHIPIVLLTAREHPIDRFWATESGADRFVGKSQIYDELPVVLLEVLASRQAQGSAVMEGMPSRQDLSGENIKSRVSRLFEQQLVRSTIRNRLRRSVLGAPNVDAAAAELLELVGLLLDARVGVLTLPLADGDVEFVRARREDQAQLDALLGRTTSPAARQVMFAVDATPSVRGGGDRETRIILPLKLRGAQVGQLSLVLRQRPSIDGEEVLAVIEADTPTMFHNLLYADQLGWMERQFETLLAQTEEFLDALSCALVAVDGGGHVVRWNRAAEELFGLPAGEVLGRPFAECGIQWSEGDAIARLAEAGREKGEQTLALAVRDAEGRERTLGCSVRGVPGSVTGVAGFVLLGSDVGVPAVSVSME